jgi:hypothetical protein
MSSRREGRMRETGNAWGRMMTRFNRHTLVDTDRRGDPDIRGHGEETDTWTDELWLEVLLDFHELRLNIFSFFFKLVVQYRILIQCQLDYNIISKGLYTIELNNIIKKSFYLSRTYLHFE